MQTKRANPPAAVNISFISGFFDGEGAIHVTAVAGSKLLTLRVSICQRSIEVLRAVRSSLTLLDIYSVIYSFASGMYCLSIIRVVDLVRFLRSVECVVKKRQVIGALDYIEGRITGNALLQVLEEEHAHHKRKTSPLRILGPNFPMTRLQALEASALESTKARVDGNRRAFLRRMQGRVSSLPSIFGVRDIERVIGARQEPLRKGPSSLPQEGLVRL
jgi:LAGLIDADG-like domain